MSLVISYTVLIEYKPRRQGILKLPKPNFELGSSFRKNPKIFSDGYGYAISQFF